MLPERVQSETWPPNKLRCMVRDGNRGAVQRLVRDGASIVAEAGRGRPLLSLAARRGHKDIVEFLLQEGVDVNEKGLSSETALYGAVKNGHTEIAIVLMEHGADVTVAKKNGRTALHLAARLGLRDTACQLVKKKADVNAPDDDLWTPLHEAARYGHFAVAVILIEAGAEVDACRNDLFTPLHSAARYGHHRIALALIDRGANVNAIRIEHWTPLLSAVRNHHTELAKDLIENGANVNDENYASCTALHLAAQDGNVDLVSTLIQNGAEINAIQFEGRTALHLAAGNNHADIVSLLIANEADKDVLDKIKGWTALNLAILYGHVKCVEKLLNSGARFNDRCDQGNTPLHSAIEKNRLDVLETMLEPGHAQNLNIRNAIGLTPLHYACLVGSEAMVERLLIAGARVDVKDDSERTPLDFARLKPQDLREKLESVFRRFESDVSETEGIAVRGINLQHSDRTAATAGQSTPESFATGPETTTVPQDSSTSSYTWEGWSAENPFRSRQSMLTRVTSLVEIGYTFNNQYKLQSGIVGSKQHIRSIVDIQGMEELVVRFYYERDRFENAKKVYSMVARSAFICRAVKKLETSETGQPSGIVLKRGKITLADWLQWQEQPLASRTWCLQHILSGIRELHSLGIVHTDLRPSKIMYFRDDVVWKLIGLDKARMAGREAARLVRPSYSAPELLKRFIDDGPSLLAESSLDMWSFGVIAYRVITGAKLFGDADDASSVAAEIDSDTIQSRLERVQIASLKEMLSNLLEIDPAKRWKADDALQMLSSCDDSSTTTSN